MCLKHCACLSKAVACNADSPNGECGTFKCRQRVQTSPSPGTGCLLAHTRYKKIDKKQTKTCRAAFLLAQRLKCRLESICCIAPSRLVSAFIPSFNSRLPLLPERLVFLQSHHSNCSCCSGLSDSPSSSCCRSFKLLNFNQGYVLNM